MISKNPHNRRWLSSFAFIAAFLSITVASAESEIVQTEIPIIEGTSLGLNGSNRAIYDLGGIPSNVGEDRIKIGLVKGLSEFGLSPAESTISKFGLVPPLGVTWATDYAPLTDDYIAEYNNINKSKKLDIRRSWAIKVDVMMYPQLDKYIFATKIDIYQGFKSDRLRLYEGEYNSYFFHEKIKENVIENIE